MRSQCSAPKKRPCGATALATPSNGGDSLKLGLGLLGRGCEATVVVTGHRDATMGEPAAKRPAGDESG
jgi:hypothetical protein